MKLYFKDIISLLALGNMISVCFDMKEMHLLFTDLSEILGQVFGFPNSVPIVSPIAVNTALVIILVSKHTLSDKT